MPPYKTTTLLHGIRALTGGSPKATPIILIPGWPQTAEAFTPLFEPLSKHYRFYALDPPGLGDSAEPPSYDTATVSKIMAEAMHATLQPDEKYHLAGHDIGGWISYPWASQYPKRIKSLSILDAGVPGFLPKLEFPLSPEANLRLWQFSFHALPELPEILVSGRERDLLNWFFKLKTARPGAVSKGQSERYIAAYSRPGAMSRGFEYYRAYEESAKQNAEFAKRKLEMPVLGLGGDKAVGEGMVSLVKKFAERAEGGAIGDCGHFLPEEQPEAVVDRLLSFLDRIERE